VHTHARARARARSYVPAPASGELRFDNSDTNSLPSRAGRYEFRYFCRSGYSASAVSNVLLISARRALSNLAKGRQSKQSSTGACGAALQRDASRRCRPRQPVLPCSAAYSGAAALANDGNTDGNFADGSVSHTMLETRPWWEVDLG
jgi:hypothetical protein